MRVSPLHLMACMGVVAAIVGGAGPLLAESDGTVIDDTTCIAEVEPNDDIGQALTLEGAGCVSGTLVEVADTDVFLWQVDEVEAMSTWSLELDGVQGAATTVVLQGSGPDAEDVIARLETAPELEQAGAEVTVGTEVDVEAGTYAVVVRRAEPAPGTGLGDDRSYQLRATAAAPATSEPTANAVESARIVVTSAAGSTATIGDGVAIELLLDTSGSMLERLGKQTKLEVAERALTDVVDQLPAGTPVALRTFKAKPRSCATVLRVPLEPLRPKAMKRTIRELPSRKGTMTPIAKALEKVPQDLRDFRGHRVVVLVTDGKEDCGGDPAAAITALSDAGLTTTVHLVGYALADDEGLRETFGQWAALGGGRYYDAVDRASLAAALESALTPPYLVFDESDTLVAQGLVGDDGVAVHAGFYRVEILSDPPMTYETLDVEAGDLVELPAGGEIAAN